MIPNNIKTGQSILIEPDKPDQKLLDYLQSLLLVFAEKSIIFASHYAKHAGRDNLSGMDTIYSLQFLAHEFMGLEDLEKCVKDLENSSECDSGSEYESDYESDCEVDDDLFTRADNTDHICKKMNMYHDSWNEWIPESDIEILLKRNIDKTIKKNGMN